MTDWKEREPTPRRDDGPHQKRRAIALDHRIGLRLRLRRVELGLSQKELAALVGLTFQQIQKYENGANRVAASRLVQIAAAVGVSPLYFFYQDGGGELDVRGAQPASDFVELIHLFNRIADADRRRAIIALVEATVQLYAARPDPRPRPTT